MERGAGIAIDDERMNAVSRELLCKHQACRAGADNQHVNALLDLHVHPCNRQVRLLLREGDGIRIPSYCGESPFEGVRIVFDTAMDEPSCASYASSYRLQKCLKAIKERRESSWPTILFDCNAFAFTYGASQIQRCTAVAISLGSWLKHSLA